jgi:hypothetical protein
VWRRERVGRTSVGAVGEAVEAVGEDLAAHGEVMVGEDPAVLGEAADVEERTRAAWTQRWSVRCQRWTRQAVREAIGEAPAVDPMTVGEVMAVQAWRRSRSGCVGGGEMIVARVCRGDTNVRSITSYITIV